MNRLPKSPSATKIKGEPNWPSVGSITHPPVGSIALLLKCSGSVFSPTTLGWTSLFSHRLIMRTHPPRVGMVIYPPPVCGLVAEPTELFVNSRATVGFRSIPSSAPWVGSLSHLAEWVTDPSRGTVQRQEARIPLMGGCPDSPTDPRSSEISTGGRVTLPTFAEDGSTRSPRRTEAVSITPACERGVIVFSDSEFSLTLHV